MAGGRFRDGRLPAVLLPALLLLRIASLLLIGRPASPGWEGRIFYSDTNTYLYAAQDLADGEQDKPLYRTPGYPVFLLLTRDLAGPPWTATMVLHQIFEFLTALTVAAASTPFLGKTAGRWAGVYYLLLPSGLIYSSFMIPDVAASFLIALSGLLWLRVKEDTGLPRAALLGAAGGVCFALALFLKPVVLYAPAVYAALAFLPRAGGWRARALFAAMVLLVNTGAYMALREHNRRSFGLSGVSTQDTFELMGRTVQIADYRGLGVGGERFWSFRDSLMAASTLNGAVDWNTRDSIYRAVTRDAFLSNPLRVAYFELSRWPKFFVNLDGHQPYLGITPRDRKPPLYVAVSSILQLPLGIALLASLLKKEIRDRLGRLFPLGMAWFLYAVPVIGPIASFRYGLLFYWALVPFAAACLPVFFESSHRRVKAVEAFTSMIQKKVRP